MLHVLKWIGIVLLIILVVVLLTVFVAVNCALWVPIRYRFEVNGDMKGKEEDGKYVVASGKISYFLSAFRIVGNLKDLSGVAAIRLFWLYLYDSSQDMDHPHNRVAKFIFQKLGLISEEDELSDDEFDLDEFDEDTGENDDSSTGSGNEPIKEEKNLSQESGKQNDSSETKTDLTKEEKTEEKKEEERESFFEKIERKIKLKYRRMRFLFRQYYAKIKRVRELVKFALKTLGKEFTKQFMKVVFKNVIKIAAHVLPTKVEGDIYFGIADSSELMGKILMWIGILYPLYGKYFKVVPDMKPEETTVNGHVLIRGRIRIGVIFFYGLKILLNKNTIKLVNYIRKNREVFSHGG